MMFQADFDFHGYLNDLLLRNRQHGRFNLEFAPYQTVKHLVESLRILLPMTCKYYQEFHICRNCDQIYWKGSHFDSMSAFIEQLRLKRCS
jgi:uncharacterized protein with PIN domain